MGLPAGHASLDSELLPKPGDRFVKGRLRGWGVVPVGDGRRRVPEVQIPAGSEIPVFRQEGGSRLPELLQGNVRLPLELPLPESSPSQPFSVRGYWSNNAPCAHYPAVTVSIRALTNANGEVTYLNCPNAAASIPGTDTIVYDGGGSVRDVAGNGAYSQYYSWSSNSNAITLGTGEATYAAVGSAANNSDGSLSPPTTSQYCNGTFAYASDAQGRLYNYSYDTVGFPLSKTYMGTYVPSNSAWATDGSSEKWAFDHTNPTNPCTSYTDRLNRTTYYNCDSNGNLNVHRGGHTRHAGTRL